VKPRISGKDATNVAMEAEKYGPVQIGPSDSSAPSSDTDQVVAQVPARTDGTGDGSKPHKAPPPRDQLMRPGINCARAHPHVWVTMTSEVLYTHALHEGHGYSSLTTTSQRGEATKCPGSANRSGRAPLPVGRTEHRLLDMAFGEPPAVPRITAEAVDHHRVHGDARKT